MIVNELKTGPWKLTDLKNVTPNSLKVFSCFHCGGGSTMGYKLAGFEVLGGVEIDPEMMAIYKANHNPKFSYLMGVQQFKNISNDQLPNELFNLDILDGSPPCSSFSMAGSREDAWGDKKKFREGQAEQVLDDLFFDYLDVANKLKPKVVVAENVKGLVMGKAKGYVKQIYQRFNEIGYDVQLFLLNAAFMGVPQRRERTFFIARNKELDLDNLTLVFNEIPISIETAITGIKKQKFATLGKKYLQRWKETLPGSFAKTKSGNTFGFMSKEHPNKPCMTITGNTRSYHWDEPRKLNNKELQRLQSFPDDYNFKNQEAGYVCGMSVPPFMMQRIADQIYKQWFV